MEGVPRINSRICKGIIYVEKIMRVVDGRVTVLVGSVL